LLANLVKGLTTRQDISYWKKTMISNHGDKCGVCGGNLSVAKPVLMGPKKGQMQRICSKCGHIKYTGAPAPATQPQSQH